MSKDRPELGEIPRHLIAVVNRTLENDLLVQSGRAKDLPELSYLDKLSVLAYQKAQNRVTAEYHSKKRTESENRG